MAIRRIAAALATLIALVALAFPALAFTPPRLDGHVVDTAGVLTQDEILALDAKLDGVRRRSGYAIVVFVAGSLEGESREDVAYTTFNTWKVGEKGLDNGVLLLIAPKERKTFIATGKGVEGQLTDLQSSDILREQVIPLLQQNHVYDAIDRGTSAIARTLAGDAGEARQPRPARPPPQARQPLTLPQMGMIAGGIVLIVLLSIVSPGFRAFLWFFIELLLFRGGRGGGGGGGWGDGGGDGGGSGYSGGGGSTGGGGAGEDY
jgi:uncharacterized protein